MASKTQVFKQNLCLQDCNPTTLLPLQHPSPPSRCYLSQLDAQNDVLVLENLAFSGYKKYDRAPHLADIDHCRVVLRRDVRGLGFQTVTGSKEHSKSYPRLIIRGSW